MNFVFVMDPLSTVMMDKDTTFILMLAAHRRGHRVFFVGDGDIVLQSSRVYFHALSVIPQQNLDEPFLKKETHKLSADEINCVFIRNDPPFDAQYLLNTWLLDQLPKHIPVLNTPHGIRTVNEKIWTAQFSPLIPRTLISQRRQDLLEFLIQEENVIAKPTDSFGGSSIFHIQKDHQNAKVILETLTQKWTRDIILQQYVPEATQGDKRILLLNGEPLGAVLRLHADDDHRNNLFAGGKALPAQITKRDLEIVEILKPELKKLGLYFVGIDVLGEYLIEVNVTSPTCLQEMSRFQNKRLEDRVIKFAEQLTIDKCRK